MTTIPHANSLPSQTSLDKSESGLLQMFVEMIASEISNNPNPKDGMWKVEFITEDKHNTKPGGPISVPDKLSPHIEDKLIEKGYGNIEWHGQETGPQANTSYHKNRKITFTKTSQ